MPIASSLNVREIPPAPPRQQSIPQIAWVLGALGVVAMVGSISYFVVARHQRRPPPPVTPPAVAVTPNSPAPAPATAPTTNVTQTTTTPLHAVAPVANVPDDSTSEHVADVSAGKVGQLVVSANVNGAQISIDGHSDPSWVTPYTIPNVPVGTHNIQISMDGYESAEQSVTVEGGHASNVVGSLTRPSAELDVATVPKGMEVVIDGKSYGPSPVTATLAPGTHNYLVKPPGGAPVEKTVTLQSGDIKSTTITVGVAIPTGIVEVRTTPPGATVVADGAPVGGLTPTAFRLAVGTHTLVISLSGYPSVRQQVTASDGGTASVNANFSSQ
jgi:hypothetical protein